MAGIRTIPPPRTIRFGPFELDVRAAELRKHGIRVRLNEQPFRILLMLLNHPGEVVLRDEIRHALWPNDTVVEFDHSINAAIQRLRDALSDSTDKSRYVETVARRGYRFIGIVEPAAEPAAAPAIEAPALPAAEPPAAVDPNDLSGQTFSHFRVIAKLGSGGMGVVYRAEDLRLRRQVALKFLPLPAQEAPPGLLDRFQREARAASALNHPNICTIYGVDEFAGQPVIVMELLEGETLEARLAKGPLTLEKALPLALQLAGALEAAHRKGIAHRDLKPANIILTKSGPKVVDFGLAKVERAMAGEEEALTGATQTGTILGTWQYMSPEQAQGKSADARSDLFSFGCILLEMLTGQRAFTGGTPADLISAILTKDPLERAPQSPSLPPALGSVIRHCLEKSAEDRFQSAHDLTFALEALSGESAVASPPPPPALAGTRRLWLAWSVAAALALGLAPFALLHFREQPPAPVAPVRFQISLPKPVKYLQLSPDGRQLAFHAERRLWVYSLESGEARDLASNTTGSVPFWSPDGRFIGYASEGKLKKIEATGGTPQTVADFDGLWGGGAWNQDDVIVFGDRRLGLFRVPVSGGVPVQITKLDSARHENTQYGPVFLPDGRHLLYLRSSTDEGKTAIYPASLDARPEQQPSRALVASNSQPVYSPSVDPNTGYLLFVRGGTLMAQPFDNRRLELKGLAAPVAGQVHDNIPGAVYTACSASANDVLVFPQTSAFDARLTWYDREGKVMGTIEDPGSYVDLALSPDGMRLAVTKERGGADASNIWLLDLSRGGAISRFTFGSLTDRGPVWSPAGNRIIFSANRDGFYDLYQKPANGGKDEEVLLKSSDDKVATSWSRDGRFLLYTAVHPKTRSDIWVLPLGGDRKPIPFLITEFKERQARFSPEGNWVAYTSDESGHDEVYVRSFSMNSAGTAVEAGGRWPISNGFGVDPRWRGDGRELYYRSRDGRIMAVEITANRAFRAGSPQPLGVSTVMLWDAAGDGRRFIARGTTSGSRLYTVILNWQASLKK